MKINEIAPGEKQEVTADLPKIMSLIEEHCSQSLAEIKKAKGLIYRGAKGAPAMFKGASRSDRQPKDSSNTMHDNFNQIVQTYGFSVDRSNSIFCTGSPKMAEGYGRMYIIFPIDGYEFLWSAKIKDMFGNFGLEDAMSQAVGKSNLMGAADNFVKTYQYTDANLAAAIQSGHEIMLKGQYYAFNFNTFYVPIYKALFQS